VSAAEREVGDGPPDRGIDQSRRLGRDQRRDADFTQQA